MGASLSLGLGQTAYVPIIQLADDDDDAVNDYTFTGRRVASPQPGAHQPRRCGFAEAKAKITVVVETESVKGVEASTVVRSAWLTLGPEGKPEKGGSSSELPPFVSQAPEIALRTADVKSWHRHRVVPDSVGRPNPGSVQHD